MNQHTTTMKALLLPALLTLAPMVQAARLQVDHHTAKAHVTLVRPCSCNGNNHQRSVSGEQEMRTFPGSISLDISGGVAPYDITWHTQPWLGGAVFIAEPGMHRVTVVDAVGERITRSIHVGKSWRYLSAQCPEPQGTPAALPAASTGTVPSVGIEKPRVRRIITDKEERKLSNGGNGNGGAERRVKNTNGTGSQERVRSVKPPKR